MSQKAIKATINKGIYWLNGATKQLLRLQKLFLPHLKITISYLCIRKHKRRCETHFIIFYLYIYNIKKLFLGETRKLSEFSGNFLRLYTTHTNQSSY